MTAPEPAAPARAHATRVIVTHAAPGAGRWVAGLERAGIDATALPLLEITAVREPGLQVALAQARAQLHDWRATMFVSGNAVAHFFEENPAQTPAVQALTAIKTRYWAPGPGTVRALLAYGIPEAQIDGPAADATQFDSEALWQRVAPQVRAGDRVLVVRGASGAGTHGGNGRDWLATQLAAAGAAVSFVAAYERHAPGFTAAQQALARAGASDGSLWLLGSSEALAHLRAWLPDQRWDQARALATHPRIATALRAAGFARVRTCRPTLADVIASIKSNHEP